MKKCSKCGIEKKYKEFWKCKKSKDGYQTYCIKCATEAKNIWRKTGNGKKYHREYMRKARRKTREKLIDILGAKCVWCGIEGG